MENNLPKLENVLKWVIIVILCFVIVMTIFITGVFIGQERARFSNDWVLNYHSNFGGPMHKSMDDFSQNQVTSAHGIFGEILKIDGNTMIIRGQDDMEKTVMISDKTVFINQDGQIKLADLKIGDSIVVIGQPNEQGAIEAVFMRVLPKDSMPMSFCGQELFFTIF